MFFCVNDSFVKYGEFDIFAKDINSYIKLIENGGHFIKDDGYEKILKLLKIIKKC